jgi:multidrug efflux pump subunit AcrB
MFLSNFSIRNPLATVVLIIAMMVMGLLALSKLKVNQNPDVAVPGLSVVIPYPGSSPDTSEREIVNRLEKQLMTIPGVKDLYSTSGEGSAQFDIMFEFSKNMVEATDEVRNAISSVRYKLPTEMREPYIVRWDPSAQPVVNIALSSSKLSHAEISRMAEDKIADKLRAIPGVANVKVNGTLKRELSVLLRAEKLREFNVSVGEVVNALRLQNANAPVGKISGDLEEESIRLVGRIETPEEFQNVVIKRSGDQIVRLGQVASIQDHFADLNSLSIRSGKPNVSLQVTKSREASAVSVAKRVREYIETANKEMESTMPGTKMDVTFDGGKNAKQSEQCGGIADLRRGADGLRGLRIPELLALYLITALSLPTSVLAAFIAVWLCGFTLNFMTLLGLSLAIGVLIDDAIVVRENIVRHMQNGSDRRTAAMEGTAEIGLAVAATTFSIVAVFVPVAFMGGMPGEWFRPFALTVTCSVLVSLVISFTLDPMLSAYWGDPADHHTAPKTGISKVLQSFNDWFDHQADRYGKVIAWALHHRRWMAFIAFGTLIAAFALQAKFGGTSFLPSTDAGSLMIQVRTPPSSSLEYARLKMERAAAIARVAGNQRNQQQYHAGGWPYLCRYRQTSERKRSAKEIAADLRSRISSLVGAEYTIQDDVNNGANKPVQIEFTGPDSRKLMEITSEYMEKLAKVPGAVDIGLSQQDPKREIRLS